MSNEYHFIRIEANITTMRNTIVGVSDSGQTACQLFVDPVTFHKENLALDEDYLVYERMVVFGEYGHDWVTKNIKCPECRYATLDAINYWSFGRRHKRNTIDNSIEHILYEERAIDEADGP